MLIDLDAPPAGRPAGRPAGARVLGVLVALLLVMAAAGAAPPPRNGAVEIATTGARPAWFAVLTDDALYAAHRGGEIRAIPLRAGGPAWSVGIRAAEPALALRGPWLIAANETGGVTLLEPRTGRTVWKAPEGAVTRVLADRVAVAGTDRLEVIEPVSGRTIWSRPVEPFALDVDDGRLVTLDGQNRATVHAVTDGRILAGPREIGAGNLTPGVRIVGGHLILAGERYVDGYRLDDLRPRWRRAADGLIDLTACAQWLCLTGQDGLTVLDPVTGAERWSSPRWQHIVRADGIATAPDTHTARLDLATGRVLQDLGRGGVIDDLMLHTTDDRTLVARLADGRILGTLPPVAPPGCSRQGPHLACPVPGDRVAVWRIPR